MQEDFERDNQMMPEPSTTAVDNVLSESVETLHGVTPMRAEQLARLGLHTLGDLIFHLPRAYEDLTDLRSINTLAEGKTQTVRGEVVEIGGRELPDGRTIVSVVITEDGKQCLEGVWFNQPNAARRFRYGLKVSFSGKPRWYRDHWTVNNPRVQLLDEAGAENTPGILAVYPLTGDLYAEQLRPLIHQALKRGAHGLLEILPAELRQKHRFSEIRQTLQDIHTPATLEAAEVARRRLVYEEFLILQVALGLRRRERRDQQRAPRLYVNPAIDQRIRRLLPFTLTRDQDRAVREICKDLASDRPMQRLLQADVGAGKTVVAAYALLVAVANKHQAILMAPTEVLARQHAQTLEKYLVHSKVRRLLLTGALSARQRREALRALREGEIDLVVGTQSLVQEDVQFAHLGLVVIDEQHKFGVHQRARLRQLGVDPHYLVMTATPIPRTVALTVFGDLDTSILRELPPGRQPVMTRWVATDQRDRVYAKLIEGLKQGRQGYLVCPLVEESASLDLKSAAETHRELQAGPFQDFRVGLLHGRLDDHEKAQVMEQFRNREIDLLVTTSIVEVGVDIPNATLLVVEHADRFGLSQLHQLRGRVSRGTVAGKCYLFGDPANEQARERLRILSRTRDGFALAEQDALLRGTGEFFGTQQHGLGSFRFGNLITDAELLQLARRDALALVEADAGLRQPEHALLRRAVLDRYGKTLDLAAIG